MREKIIVGSCLFLALLVLLFSDFGSQAKVYDCGMAEWHPDIPAEVRDECRKLRQEYFKEEQQKKLINV
jgi:hypothetical protein